MLESAAIPAVSSRRSSLRIPELDGLRGIAILLVLAFHFTPAAGPLSFFAPVFQTGWVGVDLFFVLSGYLITGILLDSVGSHAYYRNFIVRRTLRIFPLYYVGLILFCLLSDYPDPIRWKHFFVSGGGGWYAVYLGNVRASLDGRWPDAGLLTPLWSLQVEEQFYLSYPFLVAAVSRGTLAKVLTAVVGMALLFRSAIALALPNSLLWTYTFMPCRMDSLAMGGLIAVAQREYPDMLKGRWIVWVTLLSTATFLIDYLYSSGSLWSPAMRTIGYSAVDLAFAGLLAMVLGGRPRGFVALCRWRWLGWIGTISYGLYLLHASAGVIVRRFSPRLGIYPRGSVEFLACVAAAVLAAWISWSIFESPILKLKHRFAAR
jgi:peptidoglycan/LPS O-acetylase OafA/YrhL